MKKFLITSLFVSLAALLVVGVGLAQSDTPPQSPIDGPRGQSAGRFGGRGGMQGTNQGILQPYMLSALADTLDIPVTELQSAHDEGQTMMAIAEQYGINAEDLQAAMIQAREQALEAALADGVIAQEQATWMQARMNRTWPEGYGPGSQSCDDSGVNTGMGQRGGGRGRWSQP